MSIGATAARAFLGLSGWRPEGVQPTAPKYVLIAAPHTSNWDFPYTLALAWLLNVLMQ
jgi:1-acyl-sn-glycerol-3-phosphate acyltransferase